MSDTVKTIVTVAAVLAAIGLFYWLARIREKDGGRKKGLGVALLAIVLVLFGVTFGLATQSAPPPAGTIVLVDAIILFAYAVILFFVLKFHVGVVRCKEPATRRIAFLGIVIGLASALMLLGFPIMPAAPFLKVEFSGLIIFMTLLWFDWKTAALVSLATNFIHVFMPGSAPVILFLDEGVNFIATMAFLLPAALLMKRADAPKRGTILLFTVVGVAFTTVGMTLYNAYFNLPIVYGMDMPFSAVVEVFGVFNLIKWGFVALSVNVAWKRLYSLRSFREEEACDLPDTD